jgi:hypothetical protein
MVQQFFTGEGAHIATAVYKTPSTNGLEIARGDKGCLDANANGTDFSMFASADAHNTASPVVVCP